MSFRDNLLRLRTEHGMTQEQLANLIGVSRQSVAKWESDRSYPEMDKLIKMTGIFGCTLDELVMGPIGQDAEGEVIPSLIGEDVAGQEDGVGAAATENEPSHEEVAQEPASDVYGYDDHMRSYARKLAWGVTSIIAGVPALIAVTRLLGSTDPASTVGFGVLLAFVLAGLALIIPAVMGHNGFMRQHPVIKDFYTVDDKRQARQALSRGIVAGVGGIFLGIIVSGGLGFAFGSTGEEVGTCVLLLLIAASVWSFIYFSIMYSRVRVVEFNRESLEQIVDSLDESKFAASDIVAQLSEEERRLLFETEDIDANDSDQIASFFVTKRKRSKLLGGICSIIMIVATIIGLCLMFGLPVTSDYFWMAWVVGGLLCAIVSICIDTFVK